MVDHLVVAPAPTGPEASVRPLATLVQQVPLLGADAMAPDVDRLFRDDEDLGSVVVRTGDDCRLLSRTRFEHHMAGRLGFGRAVYARRSIATMLPPHTLHLDAACDLGSAARAVLSRPEARRYEDLVVGDVDPGRQVAGVVPVRALLEELARQLAHNSLHDPLTGLPNRRLLAEHLRVIESADAGPPVLLYVDLDRFKPVNDTYGHLAGDAVLSDFAGRLRSIVGGRGVAARIGGDEFALLLSEVGPAQAMAVAEQVVLAANSPFLVGEEVISVGASVGVAGLGADHGQVHQIDGVEVLLRRADAAMYRAKRGGRNRVVRAEEADRDVSLAHRLRLALESPVPPLEVHFQAIGDLRSGRTAGVECLARWRDPVLGQVGPAEFVPEAERLGLIGHLSRHVLGVAAKRAARWGTGLRGRVSVNVSPLWLAEDDVVDQVLGILAAAGLPPDRLVAEITESAAVGDTAAAVTRLDELRRRGVLVALDDFGTGASSLTLLRRLPVDLVKIDREFIERIDDDLTDTALVRMIVEAAHLSGRLVCAEGVERPSQLEALAAAGCDLAQGFLLHRPAPGGDEAPAVASGLRALTAGRRPAALGAGELTLVVDSAGRISYASSASTALLGHHPTALVGRHLADLLDAPAPPPNGVRTTGVRVLAADGSWVRLEALARPLEQASHAGGTILTLR